MQVSPSSVQIFAKVHPLNHPFHLCSHSANLLPYSFKVIPFISVLRPPVVSFLFSFDGLHHVCSPQCSFVFDAIHSETSPGHVRPSPLPTYCSIVTALFSSRQAVAVPRMLSLSSSISIACVSIPFLPNNSVAQSLPLNTPAKQKMWLLSLSQFALLLPHLLFRASSRSLLDALQYQLRVIETTLRISFDCDPHVHDQVLPRKRTAPHHQGHSEKRIHLVKSPPRAL